MRAGEKTLDCRIRLSCLYLSYLCFSGDEEQTIAYVDTEYKSTVVQIDSIVRMHTGDSL